MFWPISIPVLGSAALQDNYYYWDTYSVYRVELQDVNVEVATIVTV